MTTKKISESLDIIDHEVNAIKEKIFSMVGRDKKISVTEFCFKCKISDVVFYNWRSGVRIISLKKFYDVARAFAKEWMV